VQLNDHLFRFDLRAQTTQTRFVLVARRTQSKLLLKFFRHALFEPKRSLLIDGIVAVVCERERGAKLVMRELLYSNQKTAAGAVAARPFFDEVVDLSPAAKVEVADAEIRPLGHVKRIPQSRKHWQVNVVKNSGH
jgi:hypothetical protein